MSAAIGVSDLFGITSPSGCVVTESSSEDTVEVKTIKSQAGVTVQAAPVRMSETTVTLKGKGLPALSLVAAHSSVAADTLVVTELNTTESNDDYPDFDLTAKSWANLS